MHAFFRFLGVVLAVVLTIHFVPGLSAPGGWGSVLLVALVWSAISLLIKPLIHLLALPITIVTFGLFALVINALLFWLVAFVVPGFMVDGFGSAFLGSLVLSVLTWLIHLIVPDPKS